MFHTLSKKSLAFPEFCPTFNSQVNPDPWYDACYRDACACDSGGDCECLCTAIASYGHECCKHSVPIKWRTQELCRKYRRDAKRVEFLSCIQTKFETVKNCNTSEKNNFIEAVCNLGNQRKGKVFKNHRHGCCILKT